MKRILIIDDDFAISDNLKALLSLKGFEVESASDGETGIAAARRFHPDVILLDIMIPKVGGFDACRILRSDPHTKHGKVIMITGLDRMGDVEKAFSAGASEYLIKPFDTARLFAKIDKVLAA